MVVFDKNDSWKNVRLDPLGGSKLNLNKVTKMKLKLGTNMGKNLEEKMKKNVRKIEPGKVKKLVEKLEENQGKLKTNEILHSQKKKKSSGLTLSQVKKRGGIPGKNSEIEMEHKRKFLRKFVTPKWGKAGQGPQSKLTFKNDLNPLFSARGLEQISGSIRPQ